MVEIFIGLLSLALVTSLMYIHSLNRQVKVLKKMNQYAVKSVSISEMLRQELNQQISELKQQKEK